MANEMTATPKREYPDFPCSMKDASGNVYDCPNGSTFEAWSQSGMEVATAPKKKAAKKKATKKAGK